jgi:putative aldouronate transport system permease protein
LNTIKKLIKNRELFFLSLPGIIIIFLFSYLPMFGLILPFKNYRYDLGFWKSPWVGFDNFKFLFNSGNAWRITRNTVGLNFLFIIVTLLVSLIIALMLNELSKKSVKVYQTSMFLPYFISFVVVSYIFLALFDMNSGAVNGILKFIGKEPVLWYNEPKYWPALLVIANTWKGAGYSAIIYYAGLISIDKEFYEAAELDGAKKIQQIRLISIPLLMPLIMVLFLLSIGRIFFGNFDMFYNLTRDSSLLYPTTDVIDTFVYRSLRVTGDIGMSSAAGIYQSVVGLIIVLIANGITRKVNRENAIF